MSRSANLLGRRSFSTRVESLDTSGAVVLAMHGIRAHRGGPHHALISCPVHDDAHPSCSVNLANGRSHCFGCAFKAGDVVALHHALGHFASMGDALRDLERRAGSPIPALTLTALPERRAGAGAGRSHRGHQVVVKTWTYRLADGTSVFEILRIQFRLPDGSWLMDDAKGKPAKIYLAAYPGGTPRRLPPAYTTGSLRPLLNLPAIEAADLTTIVYVVEGEPCVDALTSLGLLATTSSGGASNPHRTDWSPLAGRRVVIWPDNDEPGIGYAQEVTARLHAFSPPSSVRWVEIEKFGLPQGGDAVDWLRRHGEVLP